MDEGQRSARYDDRDTCRTGAILSAVGQPRGGGRESGDCVRERAARRNSGDAVSGGSARDAADALRGVAQRRARRGSAARRDSFVRCGLRRSRRQNTQLREAAASRAEPAVWAAVGSGAGGQMRGESKLNQAPALAWWVVAAIGSLNLFRGSVHT